MNEDRIESSGSPNRNERRSLALSALIMSLVALLCAFIVGWRQFALVVAGLALAVAVFVTTKVKHPGVSRKRALFAIIFSLAAAAVAGYYLSRIVDTDPDAVPGELHDTSVTAPDDGTMDRLRMSMDSTQQGE
jgi:hypothetical protein